MKSNKQKPKQVDWIKVADIYNDKLELSMLKKTKNALDKELENSTQCGDKKNVEYLSGLVLFSNRNIDRIEKRLVGTEGILEEARLARMEAEKSKKVSTTPVCFFSRSSAAKNPTNPSQVEMSACP